MYCGKCGKKINAGSQFCEHCGNPVPPQAPKQKTILPVIIIASTVVVVTLVTLILLFVAPGYLRSDYGGKADSSSERDWDDDDDDNKKSKKNKDKDKSSKNDSDEASPQDAKADSETEAVTDTEAEETASETVSEEATTEDPELAMIDYAKSMSTNMQPSIADFYWYTSSVLYDGIPADAVYFNKHKLTEGGWKMYMFNDPYYEANNRSEMWANINLHTDDDDVTASATIDWGSTLVAGDDTSTSSSEKTELSGSWDNKFFTVSTDSGKLTLTDFYSKGINQFILGTFEWNDGTLGLVAMVRPGINIEYTPTENYSAGSVFFTNPYATTEATTQATTQAPDPVEPLPPLPDNPPDIMWQADVILPRAASFTGSMYADLFDIEPNGDFYIHCYDEIYDEWGSHIVTIDWLTINPYELIGYDIFGSFVDLR